MKNYSKPQMMAKNAPTGSYAAGCPTNVGNGMHTSEMQCRKCEVTK